MTILLCVTIIFGYVYEDSDSLLVDNDTLTICGSHQYALKVHLKNHGKLFVRAATLAPDSMGWLILNAPCIVMTDSSSIDGSERGHRGGYMNSHPWGYGPGGGVMLWADTVMLQHVYINAHGGNGGDAAFGGGGGAGGGRIKIFFSSLIDTSNVTYYVNAGSAGSGSYGNPQPGMSGSVHIGIQTGIHEIVSTVKPLLKIGPNPARGIIRFSADRPPGEVVVYECTGRVVMTTWLAHKSGTLDLRHLKPGIYFLKSKAVGGTITKLILIP
ncbi:T9SS type A sorting domain-containing protein [candidate division WOR-3 bacterium]|nr:T9SS type A sorting domain-containing protein [candidate division WOR-3 bacterium]